ncbi:transposase [Paraflavitalea speifideaquila]|uniref:transposase n=1 Tax=Paraflavitalea speifideaquila TaxID=3076558 RepID=UPI0028E89BB5|nr:transposase [Paraflavitalea speifideiaquila]
MLTKPIRTILFSQMQKRAGEKGIHVLAVNGVEDHVHVLIQLHPAQNLSQVVKSIRTDAMEWINETKLINNPFQWEETYAALSVNPSTLKQVVEFLGRQEEYHKTKTLESELEVFDKIQL